MTKQKVNIVEVSPRDGLQNEKNFVNTKDKINFINMLSDTGLQHIEVTSFVSPKWISQFKDASEVFTTINKKSHIQYTTLVPNVKGMQAAFANNVSSIAVFTAASETFCQKNINCSIEESIERFTEVVKMANSQQIKVRAYVSCTMGCPYEGKIKNTEVCDITERLFDLGVYEVSIGDTIGIGYPSKVNSLFTDLKKVVAIEKLALHCHDTYGMAIANIYTACELGVTTFDGSVAGLGGCPYAPGAQGNVATEDIVYLLEKQGLDTGIDLSALVKVGDNISNKLNRKNCSKVGKVLMQKNK